MYGANAMEYLEINGMYRGAKRINPSSRREIDIIKSHILSSKRGFDGSGYPFKKAVSELRQQGKIIQYDSTTCLYYLLK